VICLTKIWLPYVLKTRGSAHWACIAHLTIEWYWSKFQREIIITLKNSSHLEWRVGLSDTILKGTHPGTIYAWFGPYIDASCQVWLHLAKLFQRRRFFLTLANQKPEALKSLYRSPGYKKNQLVLCKNYVLQW
jgi:hypothetical protein